MGKLLKFRGSGGSRQHSGKINLRVFRCLCIDRTVTDIQHMFLPHAKISGRNKQSLGIRLLYFYILGAHNDINRRADTEFVQYLIDSVMIFSCNDTNLTSLFP